MQTIVAGLMALTAMGASIISDVDPVTTVVRGAIAFVVGMLLAGVWTMVVMPQSPVDEEDVEEEEEEEEEVESEYPPSEDEDEEDDEEDEDQAA